MLQHIRAFVFDLGGTLIDYEGFPLYWGDYYEKAFIHVAVQLHIRLTDEQVQSSIDRLKTYNPRLYPREVEYSPTYIFSDVIRGWKIDNNRLDEVIASFFNYFQRHVRVYPDTLELLQYLQDHNYPVGVLTDVPTGMPTNLIARDIASFQDKVDYFLTSIECGFRKPNKKGLEMIADKFQVNMKSVAIIGDEEKDIKTAKNTGAMSILIKRGNNQESYDEDLQITSLFEIKAILDSMR